MKAILIALILLSAITVCIAPDCLATTSMKVTSILNQNRPSLISTYFTEIPSGTPICTANQILLENVSSHTQCGTATEYPGNSFGFLFEFRFKLGNPKTVDFRFGVDFGLGGVVVVDGITVASTFNDQWWAGDWTNTNNLLLNTGPLDLDDGCHLVQIFGKEACCDGGQTFQLNEEGQGWVSISPAVLENLYEAPIVQQSAPCVGEAFWTSVNPAVPKHWCYCNCWVPGAFWKATLIPPYRISQLAPACVLDPAKAKFYTSCIWTCPADTSFNSFGVIPVNTWLNDCVYH